MPYTEHVWLRPTPAGEGDDRNEETLVRCQKEQLPGVPLKKSWQEKLLCPAMECFILPLEVPGEQSYLWEQRTQCQTRGTLLFSVFISLLQQLEFPVMSWVKIEMIGLSFPSHCKEVWWCPSWQTITFSRVGVGLQNSLFTGPLNFHVILRLPHTWVNSAEGGYVYIQYNPSYTKAPDCQNESVWWWSEEGLHLGSVWNKKGAWGSLLYNVMEIFHTVCAIVWSWWPPKSLVLESWSPGWYHWEVVESLGSGAYWKILRLLVCALEGDLGDPSLLLSLLLPGHEVSNFLHCVLPPLPLDTSTRDLRAITPPSHAVDCLKLWAKTNLFSVFINYLGILSWWWKAGYHTVT